MPDEILQLTAASADSGPYDGIDREEAGVGDETAAPLRSPTQTDIRPSVTHQPRRGLLALQAKAGNRAVVDLIRAGTHVQRIGEHPAGSGTPAPQPTGTTAVGTSAPPRAGSTVGGDVVEFNFGGVDVRVPAATARRGLLHFWHLVHDWTRSARNENIMLRDMTRHDPRAWMIELAGGATGGRALPDIRMWDDIFAMLHTAQDALDAHDYAAAALDIGIAVGYYDEHATRLVNYQARFDEGVRVNIALMETIRDTCAVIFVTAATAGAGSAAASAATMYTAEVGVGMDALTAARFVTGTRMLATMAATGTARGVQLTAEQAWHRYIVGDSNIDWSAVSTGTDQASEDAFTSAVLSEAGTQILAGIVTHVLEEPAVNQALTVRIAGLPLVPRDLVRVMPDWLGRVTRTIGTTLVKQAFHTTLRQFGADPVRPHSHDLLSRWTENYLSLSDVQDAVASVLRAGAIGGSTSTEAQQQIESTGAHVAVTAVENTVSQH